MISYQGASSSSGEVIQANKLPLALAVVFLLAGALSIPIAFLLENRMFFVAGYVATPVLTLMCVSWDALAQRRGSRNPWFAINKKLSLLVRLVAMAAFVPAGIQIWQIANWLGQVAVQNGWFQ